MSQNEETNWEQEIEKAKAQQVITTEPEQNVVEDVKEKVNTEVKEEVNTEVKEEVQQPTSSVKRGKNNVGRYIQIHNGTEKEAADVMDDSITDPESMKRDLKDEDTYLHAIASAIVAQTSSKQFALLKEALTDIKNSNKELVASINDLADKVVNKKPKSDKAAGRELIGKDAVMATYAKAQGLRKVFLLNSGFYIVMRSMSMAELHSFYTSVDLEASEYGHVLGGFFYMLEDLFIKKKFMDLLPAIVIDSNLLNWSKPGTLASAISLHDYDTLLWAACSLQYRKGIELDLVCTNLECKHIDHNHTVDIDKLRYNLQDKLSKEATEFLLTKDKIKESSLKIYRNEYLDFTKKISLNDEIYHLKVPTIKEYISCGESLIAEMSSIVKGKLDINSKNTLTAIVINMYRMLTPWIERVDLLEDGEVYGWTRDPAAIHNLLEISKHEDSDLYNQVKDFIQDTKLTYICYTGMECPKCHKKPGLAVSDFYPIDMQHFFFFLSCRQLESTGAL